ncbi:hypothetical protein [Pseudochrobactrum asaccharolyticum]|uniref:hypothetical protein n=1 Tax=Pseudochrobactrum asaccharolyticum TaxID=354351 RepID=UPI0040436CD5
MAVLFAAISRTGKDLPALNKIEKALPPGFHDASAVRRGNAVLYSIKYGSASDNVPIKKKDWGFEISGLLRESQKDNLITDITENYRTGGIPLSLYPNQFCALGIGDDKIIGFVGAPGTDQLFSYADDDYIVVTNRHNLIAVVIPEEKAYVRRDALILTLVQDHIRDYGASIEGIRRTEPSTVVYADIFGINYGKPSEKKWETGFDAPALIDRIDELSNDYSEIFQKLERIELGLSGGKDSRAILGLLLAGGVKKEGLNLFTGGEPYAPDVMSAQDVVENAGLSGQHTVNAPSFSLKESFGDALSWDLWIDSAGTSLADFRQMPRMSLGRSGLRVGGHEIGFKQSPNELELEPYLQSRVNPWLKHPLVQQGTCDHLAEQFISRTRDTLKSAPLHRYNAIDLAMNHIALHTSSTQTASHLGNFEVHPLLDLRFLELLVGASNELVSAQFIHYVLMRRAEDALEIPAYANDEWPQGLAQIAAKSSIPFRGQPKPPYQFLDFFPSQAGFGRHAWRFRLYNLYIPWMKEYIHSGSSKLDFLDVSQIDKLISRDHSQWNFRDIYRIGCLLKVCLTDHFGIRAWNISNRKSIEDEINSFSSRSQASQKQKAPILTSEDTRAKTESALAQSVRLIRKVEEDNLRITNELSSTKAQLSSIKNDIKLSVDNIDNSERKHISGHDQGNILPKADGIINRLFRRVSRD